MPQGVAVDVEDGFATIEFVDRSKRGQGLTTLLALTSPDNIEKQTRPRTAYRVPVDVARAAGLLDEPTEPAEDVAVDETTEPAAAKGYDDGLPDDDWTRPAVNEYAAKIGIPEPDKMKNKDLVLAAIKVRLAELAADENG